MVVPPKHPKMIIFSTKTHGCWVPLFSETPTYLSFDFLKLQQLNWKLHRVFLRHLSGGVSKSLNRLPCFEPVRGKNGCFLIIPAIKIGYNMVSPSVFAMNINKYHSQWSCFNCPGFFNWSPQKLEIAGLRSTNKKNNQINPTQVPWNLNRNREISTCIGIWIWKKCSQTPSCFSRRRSPPSRHTVIKNNGMASSNRGCCKQPW